MSSPPYNLYRYVPLEVCSSINASGIPLYLASFNCKDNKDCETDNATKFDTINKSMSPASFLGECEIKRSENLSKGLSLFETSRCELKKIKVHEVDDVFEGNASRCDVYKIDATHLVDKSKKVYEIFHCCMQPKKTNVGWTARVIYRLNASSSLPKSFGIKKDNSRTGHHTFGPQNDEAYALFGNLAYKKDYCEMAYCPVVGGMDWELDCLLLIAGAEPITLEEHRDEDTVKVYNLLSNCFEHYTNVEEILSMFEKLEESKYCSLMDFSYFSQLLDLLESLKPNVAEAELDFINRIQDMHEMRLKVVIL